MVLLTDENEEEEADEDDEENEEEGEQAEADDHPPMSPSIGRESQDKPPAAAVVDFGECSEYCGWCCMLLTYTLNLDKLIEEQDKADAERERKAKEKLEGLKKKIAEEEKKLQENLEASKKNKELRLAQRAVISKARDEVVEAQTKIELSRAAVVEAQGKVDAAIEQHKKAVENLRLQQEAYKKI